MTYIIYTYLIVNSFIAGNYLFDSFNGDKGLKKLFYTSVLFFFGAIWVLLYLISEIPIFRWVRLEIKFIKDFYLTNHSKNFIENTKGMTKEEVLEMIDEFAKESHKQNKRHNRLIQNRYGK